MLSLVGSLVPAGYSFAHEDGEALGAANDSLHIWAVSCGGGTKYLDFKVVAVRKGPPVTMMALKDQIGTSTTDANGKDQAYSPEAQLYGGEGTYQVLFTKAGKKGRRPYSFEFHCWGDGGHTETTSVKVQIQ